MQKGFTQVEQRGLANIEMLGFRHCPDYIGLKGDSLMYAVFLWSKNSPKANTTVWLWRIINNLSKIENKSIKRIEQHENQLA